MKKVWVNGTFDILHIGHLKLLEYSKSLGYLKVGIDSDDRIKELKGNDRPFNNFEDRKFFLESLKFVDEVVIFNTREELIKCVEEYHPDYMVIGDDYRDKIVYGSEHAEELIFYTKLPNYSTTNILKYENNSNR
jgi:D-beta-D-heptose 7-phosphate kinase/D-beta-D-heptose 1-phosphate adenosyltransferase